MNEKIDLILAQLQKGFPGQTINYNSITNYDEFFIKYNGLTHCLCISREFLNDNKNGITLNLINVLYHIVDIFKVSKSPMRLLLTKEHVKEVSGEYCN